MRATLEKERHSFKVQIEEHRVASEQRESQASSGRTKSMAEVLLGVSFTSTDCESIPELEVLNADRMIC